MSLRSYIWPVSASLLFHGAIVAFVLVGWQSAPVPRSVKTPQYIEAKLIELKPKSKQATSAKPKEVQTIDLTQRRREQELARQRAAEKRAAEQRQKLEREQAEEKKREALERQLEVEREKQEERERQRQQQEAVEEALEEELGLIMEDEYASEAQSYTQAIARRIEQHWSRPSSARNGMQALLSIQMVPTGRVVSVAILESSGNTAFDRSAEQAVRQVDTFPEVRDMPPEVFERYYRQFNLLFKPQDLRQ